MKQLITILKNNFIVEDKEQRLLDIFAEKNIKIELQDIEKINLFLKYKLDFETTYAYVCCQYNIDCDDEDIITIIKNISNILSVSFSIDVNKESELLRKMIIAISNDLRVIIIKLCCALYEISTYKLPLNESEKYNLNIVKEIYAPLAERFGFNALKSELEDNCFKLLQPKIYNDLFNSVEKLKVDNEKQILITKNHLEKILSELNIKANIFYRQKHLSSIYKKMVTQNISLSLVYDLIAMRVIVDSVEDCYSVLGKIHAIYKPIPSRVKDYIAVPKPNGYQSLHTTIIAENNRPLEIQIRTAEMHRYAEYGVAAHWIYKENRKQTELDKKMTWIREIMESSQDLSDKDFVEILKTNLIPDSIFVQSPKGKIFEFPKGASVIDFAYAIHSDVGNSCVGAKVNGKIKPIKTTLNNSDVVEILTSATSKGPSKDWLNFVKTISAKSKINNFFKKQLKEENIKLGKTLLEQAIKNKGILISKEEVNKILLDYAVKHNYSTSEEIYASVGYGSISVNHLVNKIYNENIKNATDNDLLNNSHPLIIKKDNSGVLIDGNSGMLIRYPKCCTPLYEDKIIGYVSRGRGVSIHKSTCPNLSYFEKERLINAEWANNDKRQALVNLKIITISGDLNKIIAVVSSNGITISRIENNFNENGSILVSVYIDKNSTLEKLIEDLYKVNGIKEVIRING